MESFALTLNDGRKYDVVYNPARWAIQDGTLFRVIPGGANGSTTLEPISLAVPIILGRRVDMDTGKDTGRIQLAAYGMLAGSYRTWTFDMPSTTLLDAASLPKVLPSKEVYAGDGVAMKMWFADLIRHNGIDKWPVSTHCGWYSAAGTATFVAPGWQVGPEVAHDTDIAADYKAAGFHRPSDVGDLATWWGEMSSKGLNRFPLFGMTLGATVGSVVAARLGDASISYTLELVAERQTGKTAMARLVQSFFGRPGKTGIELSMNTTKVGLNLIVAYLYCLPMFADDETAVAAGERDASASYLAYNIFNGASRINGAEMKIHQGGTWKTVAVVTSEAPMLRDEKRGGAQARCFTVQKHPFVTWDGEKGDFGSIVTTAVDDVIKPLSRFASNCWGHGLYALVNKLRGVEDDEILAQYDRIMDRVLARLKGHSLDYTTAREISVVLLGLWALEEVLGLDMSGMASAGDVESAMVRVAWEREDSGGVKSPAMVAWADFLNWAPQQTQTGRIVPKGEGPSAWSRNEVWGVWDLGGAAGDGESGGDGVEDPVLAELRKVDIAAWAAEALKSNRDSGGGPRVGDLFLTVYGLDAFIFRTKLPMGRAQLVEAWGKLGLLEVRPASKKKVATRYLDKWSRMGALPKSVHRVQGYLIKADKLHVEE